MKTRSQRMAVVTLQAAAALFVAAAAWAQIPVEDRGRALQKAPAEGNGRVLHQGQYRAGIAHSTLEQARHEAKLAEQDVLNARDAHGLAQKTAAIRKRELEAAEKALATVRARLTAAQKDYDREVGAVDAAHRTAPPAKNK